MDNVLRFIYPRRCVVCDCLIDVRSDKHICNACKDKLKWISGSICQKCGKPIEHIGCCKSCNSNKHKFDRAYALYVYKDEVRDSIKRFKYNKRASYAKYFGSQLVKFANEREIPAVDYVIPVPISRGRYIQRGYNQCELLVDVYCSGRNETKANLLQRIRNTKPQSRLKQKERANNVKGAFAIKDIGEDVKGKSVLIVDDIFTTGSTVDECAGVLKKAGVADVYVLCLSIRDID